MAIITDDRKVVWQGNCGVSGGIPGSSGKTISATFSPGATSAQVEAALNAADEDEVVVLNAGTYNWSSRIDWQGVAPGVVLRGAGPDVTIIQWSNFSLAGMLMRGPTQEAPLSTDANLTVDAVKGEFTITLASVPSWVTAGKPIGIDQLDESSFVLGDDGNPAEPGNGESYREIQGNGSRGLGMINRVVSKTATQITFELPLSYGFKTAQTAQIFQPAYVPSSADANTMLTGCGIEDMTLRCTFSGGGTRVVKMETADSCYLKNVEFDSPSDVAVFIEFSYRCEVRHCYMHDFQLLGGGQGYGVAIYHVGTGILIEDNIITDSHNAMSVNHGGAYNAFVYNYEADGQSGSGQNPGGNTHGVHSYMNIFEGNLLEDKILFDWTNASGSHQTVFRNRITGDNPNVGSPEDSASCVSVEYYNRYCNIIANHLGTNGAGGQNKYLTSVSSTTHGSQGSILIIGGEININEEFSPSDAVSYTTGSFILIHANYDTVQDTITYDGNIADHDPVDSYVYASKPAYFGSLAWPPYDPATPRSSKTEDIEAIPAGYRFLNGVDPPASGGSAGSSVVGKVTVSGKVTIT